MKGEWFDIFYAQISFSENFRKRVYDEGKDLADSVFCLKSDTLRHNLFLVDDSGTLPISVLLRPDLDAHLKKKAKDCCDKACNHCILGCVDTPAAGYLIKERMKNYFRKDGHLRHLYSRGIAETLEAMKLEATLLEEKKLQMILSGSGFEEAACPQDTHLVAA